MSEPTNPSEIITTSISRRRKAKAVPKPAGARGSGLETTAEKDILNADIQVAETRSRRDTVAEWIKIRAAEPDITTKEIALRLGLQPRTVYSYVSRAAREGWLKFDGPMSRLEYELIPKTVDVLNEHLDQGDKTVALEIAKGTLFKQYQDSKGISQVPNNVLALKIELPEGTLSAATGHIVGSPKVYEVEEDNVP